VNLPISQHGALHSFRKLILPSIFLRTAVLVCFISSYNTYMLSSCVLIVEYLSLDSTYQMEILTDLLF
jgi:hypothetical protein